MLQTENKEKKNYNALIQQFQKQILAKPLQMNQWQSADFNQV
jgi:hypothetical protein